MKINEKRQNELEVRYWDFDWEKYKTSIEYESEHFQRIEFAYWKEIGAIAFQRTWIQMEYSWWNVDSYSNEYSILLLEKKSILSFGLLFEWLIGFDNKCFDLLQSWLVKNHLHRQTNLHRFNIESILADEKSKSYLDLTTRIPNLYHNRMEHCSRLRDLNLK